LYLLRDTGNKQLVFLFFEGIQGRALTRKGVKIEDFKALYKNTIFVTIFLLKKTKNKIKKGFLTKVDENYKENLIFLFFLFFY